MAEKPGLTKAAARAVGETLGERVARGELRDARAHELMRAIAESVTHSKARHSDMLDGYDPVFARQSIRMPKRRNPPRSRRRSSVAPSSKRRYRATVANGRKGTLCVEFAAKDDGTAVKYAQSALFRRRLPPGARLVSLRTVDAAASGRAPVVPRRRGSTRARARKNPTADKVWLVVRLHRVLSRRPKPSGLEYLGPAGKFVRTKAAAVGFVEKRHADAVSMYLASHYPAYTLGIIPAEIDEVESLVLDRPRQEVAALNRALAAESRGARPPRKNPAPARADRALERASKAYADFTGRSPKYVESYLLKDARAGWALGEVPEMHYIATRDGERAHYVHKFRRQSRPLLVSSSDGSQLYLLGGAYSVTDRGIEDR